MPPTTGEGGTASLIYFPTISVQSAAMNVVGVIPGSDSSLKDDALVLTAHLDHLGVVPRPIRTTTDSVFNGANEGGSESVALLELVEYFSDRGNRPLRPVYFIWTAGHAQSLAGAESLAPRLIERRRGSVALTLANLAHTRPGDRVTVALRNGQTFDSVDVENTVRRALSKYQLTVAQSSGQGCTDDDQAFARAGFSTVRVSGENGPVMHAVGDDVDIIDFNDFAAITNALRDAIASIASQAKRLGGARIVGSSARSCSG